MNGNMQLLSEMARKSLKGDENAFRVLMKLLNDLDHPILADIDRRVVGVGALEAVLAPISTLVLGNPRPRVSSQAIVWETGERRPHSVDGPAEMWFGEPYIAYSINGLRHREEGPAVIDISNEQISYFLKGKPRTHKQGPFRVERHEGHIMMTYVLGERMVKKSSDNLLGSYEDDSYDLEEPGAHVTITREYVDVEGIGQSPPSDEDLRNLSTWSRNYEKTMSEARRYLEDYLNKFR